MRVESTALLLVSRGTVIARLTKSAETISAIRFEIAALGMTGGSNAQLAMTIINQAVAEHYGLKSKEKNSLDIGWF